MFVKFAAQLIVRRQGFVSNGSLTYQVINHFASASRSDRLWPNRVTELNAVRSATKLHKRLVHSGGRIGQAKTFRAANYHDWIGV